MASKRKFRVNEELSEFATKLWELDENRCEPGVDFELDLQGYVTNASRIGKDYARRPFFSWVDDRVFKKETYHAFIKLLDNYETSTDRPEEVTQEEVMENRHFIDVIMETAVMKELHKFLAEKDKAPVALGDFKWMLYNLWFKPYRRLRGDSHKNSSGFEHVFVGETRGRDEVTGFHNWIQFYLQEKLGNIDYRGYFRRGTTTDVDEDFDDDYEDDPGAREDNPRLVTIQFIWSRSKAKPIGSSFIGTSPEFEMALYTMVHALDGSDKIPLRIAHYDVEICCHGHGKGIGSAYPVAK